MALKTHRVFKNDKNRKTATQNGQKPKNRTIFWWENANRKLLLKPQNRMRNRQKPQNRTKNRQKPQNRTKNRRKPQNRKPLTPPSVYALGEL